MAPASPPLPGTTKMVANLKPLILAEGQLPYLRLLLQVRRGLLHAGGTISTLQMWKLRPGEAWKSQGSPVWRQPEPRPAGSFRAPAFRRRVLQRQGVCPACPLHPRSQGCWHLGPEGRKRHG